MEQPSRSMCEKRTYTVEEVAMLDSNARPFAKEVAKTFFTALSVIPCDVAHHQKNQKNGGIVCNAVSLHTTA